MASKVQPAHPRHADLVDGLEDYLSDIGKSARWLGLQVAGDARLVTNLRRGQHYAPEVMTALRGRLRDHYERCLQLLREPECLQRAA